MLNPDDRSHLFQLLRPPLGYNLDYAVGTTFSLDLFALLTLPIAFASMDWETAEGEPTSNPVVLLEAVRRYTDRMTIFSQAGRIAKPRKHQLLFAYLESSITEVRPSNLKGVFHPKVWILRFTDGDRILYRLLCLSRNLTFDRSWDTVISLEGHLADRVLAIAKNHVLGNFLAALPDMAIWRMPAHRAKRILEISEELRRVKFDPPPGFDDFEFWAGGLDEAPTDPFSQRVDQGLIISPFLPSDFGGIDGMKESVCDPFLTNGQSTVLVSRHESLRAVNPATLKRFKSIRYMDPNLPTGLEAEEGKQIDDQEALEGLHAKVYIVDRGWKTSVFSGSFNATYNAFHLNVEFMIELIGSKSKWGVDRFLNGDEQSSGFGSLLKEFEPEAAFTEQDKTGAELDQIFSETQQLIVSARLFLRIREEGPVFYVSVIINSKEYLANAFQRLDAVRFWPISLHEDKSLALDPGSEMLFKGVSFEALTPLVAFRLTATAGGVTKEMCFVLNLPFEGGPPPNRLEKVLASIINDKEKLFRLIWLILAAGESDSLPTNLRKVLDESESNAGSAFFTSGLFEMLLEAMTNPGRQLHHVVTLIESIKNSPEGSRLLTEDFLRIWEPIAKAATEMQPR